VAESADCECWKVTRVESSVTLCDKVKAKITAISISSRPVLDNSTQHSDRANGQRNEGTKW